MKNKFILILSKTAKFRLFQIKEFAGAILKLTKNGGKFSKRVENTLGKGEIARNEQFPTVFSRLVLQTG